MNLREHVLEYRIRYSVAAMDDKARQALLEKASRSVCPAYWSLRLKIRDNWTSRKLTDSWSSTLT